MINSQPAVYILANKRNGTLYVGVTRELLSRVKQHKDRLCDGFTAEHGVDQLMYFELHDEMTSAITREKQLKRWHREWKLRLIEKQNREWRDLWPELVEHC